MEKVEKGKKDKAKKSSIYFSNKIILIKIVGKSKKCINEKRRLYH